MEIKDWIDQDDISAHNADGGEEDQSKLTKVIPEWMPNGAQRSQLLQHFQDCLWHFKVILPSQG